MLKKVIALFLAMVLFVGCTPKEEPQSVVESESTATDLPFTLEEAQTLYVDPLWRSGLLYSENPDENPMSFGAVSTEQLVKYGKLKQVFLLDMRERPDYEIYFTTDETGTRYVDATFFETYTYTHFGIDAEYLQSDANYGYIADKNAYLANDEFDGVLRGPAEIMSIEIVDEYILLHVFSASSPGYGGEDFPEEYYVVRLYNPNNDGYVIHSWEKEELVS